MDSESGEREGEEEELEAFLERVFTRVEPEDLEPEQLRIELMHVAQRFQIASARTGDQSLRKTMVVLWALAEREFGVPDEWARDARKYFERTQRGPRDLGEGHQANELEYLRSGIEIGVNQRESPRALAKRFLGYLRICTQLLHRTTVPARTTPWGLEDRKNVEADIWFQLEKFYPDECDPERIVREGLKAVGYQGQVKDLFSYRKKREERAQQT